MSRFASIKSTQAALASADLADIETAATKPLSRIGKKAISGYFSPEMSRALQILALELDLSLQAVMGEAFDDLLRKYGKHPFGER